MPLYNKATCLFHESYNSHVLSFSSLAYHLAMLAKIERVKLNFPLSSTL